MKFDISEIEESRITLAIAFLLYIVAGNVAFKKARDAMELLEDSVIFKYIIVFSTGFVVSQNIKISIVMIALYALLFDGLLNPDSKIAIVTKKKKPILPAE